jgi:hypothetical protein
MMNGVGKEGGGGVGDHEESPLSYWEARKEEAGKEEIEREGGRELGCQVSKSKDRSTKPLDAAKQGGGSSSSSFSSSSKYPSMIFSSLFLLSLIFYHFFFLGIGFDNSNFTPIFQVEILFLACLFVCLLACLLACFFVSREFQWRSNYKQARVIARYLAPPLWQFQTSNS